MRIAYGVAGEGMGHAMRSACVIEHLLEQGDDVETFTSSRAYTYLSSRFDRVHKIKGFQLTYKDDELLNAVSTFEVIKTLPHGFLKTVRHVLERFLDLKPEIIVTDHENFTALIGRLLGIPVIYAGNIAILERANVEYSGYLRRYPKLIAQTVTKLSSFRATNYVIPTFFYPDVKGSNVLLTDPVVRRDYETLEPESGAHLFVYQTSSTNEKLLTALRGTGMECRIYGYGERERDDNLIFSGFDEARFARDLASSKAAVLGGGFTAISEALYLRKPVYCVPLRNHFEQMVNADQLEKRTFGEHHEEPDPKRLFDFTLKLDLYQHYLDRYSMDPRSFERTVREVAMIKKLEPNLTRMQRGLSMVSGR